MEAEQKLTKYFNEEVNRITELALTLPKDSTGANTVYSLLIHDIQAMDMFATNCIEKKIFVRSPETSAAIYGDTQAFYMFASKVMLEMYLFLKEVARDDVARELQKKINNQSDFKEYVLSGGTELTKELRGIFGKSLSLMDRCIYFKRNKMIEHWADNPSKQLFPVFFTLTDAHILYFVNNDKFHDYIDSNDLEPSISRMISNLKNVSIDASIDVEQKLAVLEYFYPKLSSTERSTLDNISNIEYMICLPVSKHLIGSLKKFLSDILSACEKYSG